jgi:microsomal epoxide hydrolase
MRKPEGVLESEYSPLEQKGLARFKKFMTTGTAYSMEHGSRTATIGLVLSSSPLALLAW